MIKKYNYYLLSILFCASIFLLGILSIKNAYLKLYEKYNSDKAENMPMEDIIKDLEVTFSDNFTYHNMFMNGYSLSQRLLNRHVIGMGNVYCDYQHKLHLYEDEWYKNEFINNAINLNKHCNEINIPFLYVATPSKTIRNYTVLPPTIKVTANDNLDDFLLNLKLNDVQFMDLREYVEEDKFDPSIFFYNTDHHWTNVAAFWAFDNIIDKINDTWRLGIDSESEKRDINNWNIIYYKDRWLGSQGIRVGSWYVGKDDFTLIYPKFETNYLYTHIVKNEKKEYSGDFVSALIDKELLDGETVNAYLANLKGGYVENIVVNKSNVGDKKLLLIADSFGRAITPYFSTCFKEVRYIDPQPGRFNDDVFKYIDEYNPDIVIALFTGECAWTSLNVGE